MKKIQVLLIGLVLVVSLVAGCGSRTTGMHHKPASPETQSVSTPETKPGPPVVNPAAFKSQGDLAFVWDGLLYNLDGSTGKVRQLTKSGQAFDPGWSHDGKWLAFVQVTDSQAMTGPLWLARRDGTQAHPVRELPGPVSGGDFAWSPTADVLAVRGKKSLLLVSAEGIPRRLVAADYPSFAWSPDGRYLAFNVTLPLAGRTKATDWEDRTDAIYTVGVGGGQPVRQLVAPDKGMIEVAAWWPDGQGLLYWLAPVHGVSIMSDGLGLWSLRLGEGTPKPLTTCLVQKVWLSFSPQGRLLMVKAHSRFLWESKELAVADVKTGSVETIKNPAGDVTFDPSFSPDGRRIAFVAGKDMAHAAINGSRAVNAWMAMKTLWVENSDGSGAHPLLSAGPGVSQPAWSRDGNSLLYARDNALWMIGADGGVPQRIIAGPSSGSAGDAGFYDYPASDNYAWFQPT